MLRQICDNCREDGVERVAPAIGDAKSSTGEYRERTVEILRTLGQKRCGRVFRVRPDYITRNFRFECSNAGIPDFTLHDHRGEAPPPA
ncbi:MAG: hypothetical protein P4M05_27865 [Bradyrhizobium sp.]|nr:hypothetical protein [Bradyrhizobium sp.]